MDYRRFNKTIVARIDKGEEIITKMMEICSKENIKLANINALGAVGKVTVGLYDTKERKYYKNTYERDFEIVSLTGTVNTMNEEPYSHLHIAVADIENKVYGGHLNEAVVSATCEMVINIIDGNVDRIYDEETGLNIFKF